MDRKDYKDLIKRALKEDLGKNGDLTSQAIFPSFHIAVFILLSKDTGVLCGQEIFTEVFRQLDRKIRLEWYFSDGDQITRGDIIARVHGSVRAILSAERTALNIISHLSGIATKSHIFSSVTAGGKPVVLDTRKTIPGLRALQKYAVRTGGATNHRKGLYDMILIKDNHIDAAGGISQAVSRVRKRWGAKYKIEAEARNLDEVQEALLAGVDRIMLDNMSNDEIRKAVACIQGRAETEASGNMSLERLSSLPETGVDFVSFGELTHTVRVFDFSLKEESCQ